MLSCIFCGRKTDVEPVKLPKTFTAFQLLQDGDGACSSCREKLADPKYRRNCWLSVNGAFELVEDPLQVLLNPPMPPFILYLTKGKRKHGWILAVQNPVLNREKFIVVVDEEKILVQPEKLCDLVAKAEHLRLRKIPKKVLLSGFPWASVIRKYQLGLGECKFLKAIEGNKMWELAVKFGS